MKKQTAPVPKLLRIIAPGLIIATWFVVGGIGGPYFGKISEVASNDQSAFLPASAESTQVNDELKKFRNEKSIPAIIVFTDDDKKLPADTLSAIKNESTTLKEIPGVVGEISPPILSDDTKAALVVVNIGSDAEYRELVPKLTESLEKANIPADFKISGPVGFLSDLAGAFSGIDGLLLIVALAVVFVILLIVYRSPILPFLVLFNSIFALCGAILIVFYLAKYDAITLNGQVQGILFILVIGAATDYALLFVARYREELTRHQKAYQAILTSWKRSLEPIAAAGGTVIAGLLCLLLSDLNSNKALGPVGAIGIVMAIVATLTLLPSLLLMWGRKLFWPQIPQYSEHTPSTEAKKGIWPKIADFVARHARSIWITTTIALIVMAIGVTQLRADGVAQSDFILGTSEARDGQQLINKHFPGGSGTPTQIIISSEKINDAVAQLEADAGVATVSVVANNSASGTMPLGREEAKIKQQVRDAVTKQLANQKAGIRSKLESEMKGTPSTLIDQAYNQVARKLPSVDSIVAKAYPFTNASPKIVDREVLIEATLTDNADSRAAQATVERLRLSAHEIDPSSRVGGVSAVQLDTRKSAERDQAVVIPAVLAVITLILMALLRSVLAPILLLLTTVLSFAAILGLSAVVFNNLLHFPGADPSVVLYGFIFLVALGIDYNIFLITRVREESLNHGTRKGTLIGLVATGSVITSAGIVLAATFAALAVIPILFLVQLAFIVALGVLIDTIIVRSLLVPALTYDIGNKVWWPSKRHKD